MTAKRQIHVRSIVVIALGFIVGILAWSRLSDPFLDTRPSMRWLIAFGLPTATLVIYGLFRSLWAHDRVRTGNGAFEATYQGIVFRTVLFVFAMHTVLIIALLDALNAVGIWSWGGRAVIVMLGLTIMAIGNLLPRTRPNVAFGVRTRKTLTDAQLWQQIHRVGGYLAVAIGILTAIGGLTARPQVGLGTVVFGALFASMILFVSYHRYARA